MLFLKEFSNNMILKKKTQQTTKRMKKLRNMQIVKSTNCKVNLHYLWETEHMRFCLSTISRAKSPLYWSVIHYQVAF